MTESTTSITLRRWSKNGRSRLYASVDGEDKGYLECVGVEQRRTAATYYDRHRMAKGDTVETVNYSVGSTLTEWVEQALLSLIEPTDDPVTRFQRVGNLLGGKQGRGYRELNREAVVKIKS